MTWRTTTEIMAPEKKKDKKVGRNTSACMLKAICLRISATVCPSASAELNDLPWTGPIRCLTLVIWWQFVGNGLATRICTQQEALRARQSQDCRAGHELHTTSRMAEGETRHHNEMCRIASRPAIVAETWPARGWMHQERCGSGELVGRLLCLVASISPSCCALHLCRADPECRERPHMDATHSQDVMHGSGPWHRRIHDAWQRASLKRGRQAR